MRRITRDLLGATLITLGAVLYIASIFAFMDGFQNQRCLTSFILGIVCFLIGGIIFWFKSEKKIISIFFSLSMTATFICFMTNFALFIANLPTIDLFSIVGLISLILTGICIKKYCS